MLSGKKILLGVTGSIAAYKSAVLVRLLVKAGAEVKVVMTPAAKNFITPLTLSTLSKNQVLSDFAPGFSVAESEKEPSKTKRKQPVPPPLPGDWNNHVELGLWADAIVIAPASANTISKMASGHCDNFLMAVFLSSKCPVFVAPAMDLDMFKHSSTRANLKKLVSFSGGPVSIIRPATGELASGLQGEGRMEEPEAIVNVLQTWFGKKLPLAGKKVLITAGPTFEPIDPVRFIGNYSSGKMGFALAEEAAEQGARVTVVAGPVSIALKNNSIRRIDVSTAREMFDETTGIFPSADITIMSAAVADYKPAEKKKEKIKKRNGLTSLQLIPTDDILAHLGKTKRKNQLLVGFALETEKELEHAQQKLKNKNLDFIVLNSLKDKGAGFRYDTNKISIVGRQNNITRFELKPKQEVAKDIIAAVIRLVKSKKTGH